MNDGRGNPSWVTADLVDVIDGGCGLALMTLLRSGSTVVVRGKLAADRTADHLRATVRWCAGRSDGTFRAGLEFLNCGSTFELDEEQTNPINLDKLDWYEVMQLSPNADADTISRVYRMLAFRYHPDNAATGNSETFILLSEAHQILGDPEKRASYDVRHRKAKRLRAKILDQTSASAGIEIEKRGRFAGVTAAYLEVLSLECAPRRMYWEG